MFIAFIIAIIMVAIFVVGVQVLYMFDANIAMSEELDALHEENAKLKYTVRMLDAKSCITMN